MKYIIANNVHIHNGVEKSIVYFSNQIEYTIEINTIGAEILLLCNGQNSIKDIANILMDEYDSSEGEMNKVIEEFINNAIEEKIINVYTGTTKIEANISGSFLVDAPMSLSIELTKKCPLKCVHCYVDAQPNNNTYIPYNNICNILNEANKLGVLSIMLTGGEVFEHKDTLNIIEMYACKFKKFVLNTSGYYMNDDIINAIKKGVTQVRISIDGNREIHNKIRSNKNAYDLATKAISCLSRNNINTSVIMTISKINSTELEFVAKLAKELGANSFEYGFVLGIGRCNPNLELTPEEISCINRKATVLKQELNTEKFFVLSREDAYKELSRLYKPDNCGAAYSQVSILADGDVVPCFTMPFNIKLGNIYSSSLTDIMCSKISSNMKKLKCPPTEDCINCNFTDICSGCFAKALTVDPNCKWSQRFKEGIVNV